MPKLYRILWTLAILCIVIITTIFSFGIILVGVVMVSLFGIYRHYFPKKRSTKYHTKSTRYTFGEVIDLKPEVIDCTIQSGKPDKIIR